MRPGTRLGPYEIVSLLGAGGMGEVYRAMDVRLRREVAVKVLPPIHAGDPDRVRRFRVEALAAAALNHPNIAAVYDVGSADDTPFVVSELLEGESLRRRLSRGPLPPARAVDYATQIAAGLAAAHGKGVIHRDLKPENLFVTADGRIKILDFGIAKLVERGRPGRATGTPSTVTLTEPGTIVGTLGYMSPEQIRGQEVDARGDIFSLGCVLYEMLAGRRAFARDTAADAMAAALQEDPPPLSSVQPAVSSALERIVLRCLEKTLERRFQSTSDLAFALSTTERMVTTGSDAGAVRPSAAPTHAVLPLPDGARLAGQAAPAIAISRDGTRLACVVSSEQGPSRLCVTFLDRGETIEIPESEGAVGPCFSPDGAWVAFAVQVAVATRGAELRKHSFSSHLTQTVCSLLAFEGASWAQDGAIYFVADAVDGLHRVPADGGVEEPVRRTFRVGSTEAPRCIGYPQVASNGRSAVVLDWDASALGDTSVLNLATGELRSIARGGSSGCILSTGHALYTKSDGTLLAAPVDTVSARLLGPPVAVAKDVAVDVSGGIFAVSETGTLVFARGQVHGSVFEHKQLVRLAPDRRPAILPIVHDSVTSAPRVAPDRRQLAVTSRIHGIWICDVERGTRTRLPPGATRLVRFPVWTPDGAKVVFRGALVGEMGWKVFWQWADGRGVPEVLIGGDAREKRPCAITPDGGVLLCAVLGAESDRGLYAFPMPEGGPPERIISGPVEDAALSPGGDLLAYQSSMSGATEVFVRRVDDQGIGAQVSVGGGSNPRWSSDGHRLLYLSGDAISAVPIEAADGVTIGSPRVLVERRGLESYDVDGETIVAAERPAGSGDIRQLQIVTNWFSQLLSLAPLPGDASTR
jgi:serine/threonine protein kinase